MHNIYFDSRTLTLCSEQEIPAEDPGMVLCLNLPEENLNRILMDFKKNKEMQRLCLVSEDSEQTYRMVRSCFTEINAGGGLVTDNAGKYLMIFRNGVWDLPKGKQEPGEPIELTALREVSEECGIKGQKEGELICITDHTYHRDGKSVLKHTYWYRMECCHEDLLTPQTEEGISNAVWAERKQIPEMLLNTYPSIREVFTKAGL